MSPNTIPTITDPLGRSWDQPSREHILIDDTHALMSRASFEALAEYSATVPSGVYDGKMWKRCDGRYARSTMTEYITNPQEEWLLCWYGPSSHPGKCSINWRRILIV